MSPRWRWAAVALLAAALVATLSSPVAAQSSPEYRVEEAQQLLEDEITECETLAANPAPTNRADKDTLEKWAACARLLEDTNPADLDRDSLWFGSAAYTSEGFSLNAYVLYFDAGEWDRWGRKFMGGTMVLSWTVGVWSLRAASWAFDWVLNGRLTDILIGIPDEIRDQIVAAGVLGGMLGPLAILATSAVAVFAVFRQRTAEGVSHLVWLILVVGVGAVVLSDVDRYYDSVRSMRDDLGGALIDASGLPHDANGYVDAGERLAPLMSALVHDPWSQLNWGQLLTDQDCVDKASNVLARRGGATSVAARDAMKGCPGATNTAANHAYNPTATRTLGAMLIGAAQLCIAMLIVGVALVALGSEILLAAAFAALPAVIVLAAFPGGRRIAAGWLSLVVQGTVGLTFGILLLRLVETVFVALATSSVARAMPMLSLFVVLLVTAVMGMRYGKRLPEAARAFSRRFGSRPTAAAATAANAGRGVRGGSAFAQTAGPARGSEALAAEARAARRVERTALARGPKTETLTNREGRTKKPLGRAKGREGANLAMGTALANAQTLGTRRSVGNGSGSVESAGRAVQHVESRREPEQAVVADSADASLQTLAKTAVSKHNAVRAAVAAHHNTAAAVRSELGDGGMARRLRRRAHTVPRSDDDSG